MGVSGVAGVMGWVVAVVALQMTDPTATLADQPSPPSGPVDRAPAGSVTSPAGTASGSVPGEITIRSEMGQRYRLVGASVLLDGKTILERQAAEGEELEKTFTAFRAPMAPGGHALNVSLVYEGRNPPVISYMDDYRFTVQSGYSFVATADRPAGIDVVARQRKSATMGLEDRPSIDITPASGSGVVSVVPAGVVAPRQEAVPPSKPTRRTDPFDRRTIDQALVPAPTPR